MCSWYIRKSLTKDASGKILLPQYRIISLPNTIVTPLSAKVYRVVVPRKGLLTSEITRILIAIDLRTHLFSFNKSLKPKLSQFRVLIFLIRIKIYSITILIVNRNLKYVTCDHHDCYIIRRVLKKSYMK